ncbi:hypothetical protein C9890_0326 [Perkinsus sp. BL_2016]|nr:hypothetical protein C9890_0326 [Perkinsus sp. BL_2016]
MDLDLPMIRKKLTAKTGSRILSDNSEDNDKDNIEDSGSLDSISSDSFTNDSSQTTLKTSKNTTKKQFLSTEWIVDSDSDDGGADYDPSKPRPVTPQKKEKASTSYKSKKVDKSDFKKASEDFKSRLMFISSELEDTSNEELSGAESNSESDGNEADSDDRSGNVAKTNLKSKPKSKLKSKPPSNNVVKKPKETLKNVLKESEALLRRVEPFELCVSVPKPKSLNLVCEALAANSRSPAEARKRVMEEQRKLQRNRLEKFLGPERMAKLKLDDPKIGQTKLDETVEVELRTSNFEDEKANEGSEGVTIERIKMKLIDLPDKHFHPGFQGFKRNDPNSTAGYKVHLQGQKKASIETLNRQLEEKIAAQGSAFMAHHHRAREAQAIARRTKAAEREKTKRLREAKKDMELKEKRERKAEGGDLFSSKKYEGIERIEKYHEAHEVEQEAEIEFEKENIKIRKAVKIVLSDDSDEGCAELLDLDLEPETEDERNSISGLLSGKFESDPEEEESENENDPYLKNDIDPELLLPTMNEAIQLQKSMISISPSSHKHKQSAFIDDEASDEDEERQNEEIDEAALQEEMVRSKFIASDTEFEDDNAEEMLKFRNAKQMKDDEELTKRLVSRLGRHVQDDDDEMLNELGNKYGLMNSTSNNRSRRKENENENEYCGAADEDDELKSLLLAQKRKKIDALGTDSFMNRKRSQFNTNDDVEEFQFKGTEMCHQSSDQSDFYSSASETETEKDDDSSSSDEGSIYEREESGLQSRLNEQVDVEEEQVQAAVGLDRSLNYMVGNGLGLGIGLGLGNVNSKGVYDGLTVKSVNETVKSVHEHETVQNAQGAQNNNTNKLIPSTCSTRLPAALSVPKGDAKLRLRLMALQGGDTDENVNYNDRSVFKTSNRK